MPCQQDGGHGFGDHFGLLIGAGMTRPSARAALAIKRRRYRAGLRSAQPLSPLCQQPVAQDHRLRRQEAPRVPCHMDGERIIDFGRGDLPQLTAGQQRIDRAGPARRHALPVARGLKGDDIAVETPDVQALAGKAIGLQKARPDRPGSASDGGPERPGLPRPAPFRPECAAPSRPASCRHHSAGSGRYPAVPPLAGARRSHARPRYPDAPPRTPPAAASATAASSPCWTGSRHAPVRPRRGHGAASGRYVQMSRATRRRPPRPRPSGTRPTRGDAPEDGPDRPRAGAAVSTRRPGSCSAAAPPLRKWQARSAGEGCSAARQWPQATARRLGRKGAALARMEAHFAVFGQGQTHRAVLACRGHVPAVVRTGAPSDLLDDGARDVRHPAFPRSRAAV